MELTFQMNYDRKSMTAMAKAMRTVLQEKEDKKSKIIGWSFIAATVLILCFSKTFDYRQILAIIAAMLLGGYMLFQDQVNGILALNRLAKQMRSGTWLFREDGYFSNTEAGESDFSYENIFAMVEMDGYMFLVFHNKQAQIIELSTVQGGTAEDFRRLLRKKTQLTIQKA